MHPRTQTSALLLALAVTFAPAPAPAAPRSKIETRPESLSPADRQMYQLAQDFAYRCTKKMEEWVATKKVSPERLFAALYFPIAKTDPPKFTTDWDELSDKDILPIEEFIKDTFKQEAERTAFQEAAKVKPPTIVFAVLVDRNGYLPTHNKDFSKKLTGTMEVDLSNNRTKRIFNDQTGLAAARNAEPVLLQTYLRDTGEVMNDLSVPVKIGDAQWGAVRIGYVTEAR
jgi:methyl-accepting chemotaxis protein